MGAFNDLIHQPIRLKIMASLNTFPIREPVEFVRLRDIIQATEGNLGAHLSTLEKAGYIEVLKDFFGKKPRTRVQMTLEGREAFRQHVLHLTQLLSGDH
jgi:DNA-binding MarR family transcriptional regulator